MNVYTDRYDSLFQYYGSVHTIDWKLLKAQALAESGMMPTALSNAGAKGLCQFMDATWKEWGRLGDPYNPEHSIEAQARYMLWLLAQFQKNERLALASYNWGIGNVRKHLTSLDWPKETRKYVDRIIAIYHANRGV